jgi:hypothetical protein
MRDHERDRWGYVIFKKNFNRLNYILLLKKFVSEVFIHKESTITITIDSRHVDERIAVVEAQPGLFWSGL